RPGHCRCTRHLRGSGRRRRWLWPRGGPCALNGRRSGRFPADPGIELRYLRTIFRPELETPGDDLAQCRGELVRQHDAFPALVQAGRPPSGKRLEETDAERPDVAGRRMDSVPGFRRIVHGSRAAAAPGVTEVTDGVARQL